jgi:hypothetical protein
VKRDPIINLKLTHAMHQSWKTILGNIYWSIELM